MKEKQGAVFNSHTFFFHDFKQHAISYDRYGLARSFIAKLLKDSLYGGRTASEKAKAQTKTIWKIFSRVNDLNFDLIL